MSVFTRGLLKEEGCGMQSIKYTNRPRECDELLTSICKSYQFAASEYPTAWLFREFLKKLDLCDFSEILDDVYVKQDKDGDPFPVDIRIIFFTCLPKDMERMACITEYFPFGKTCCILDEEGGIIYGKEF